MSKIILGLLTVAFAMALLIWSAIDLTQRGVPWYISFTFVVIGIIVLLAMTVRAFIRGRRRRR